MKERMNGGKEGKKEGKRERYEAGGGHVNLRACLECHHGRLELMMVLRFAHSIKLLK